MICFTNFLLILAIVIAAIHVLWMWLDNVDDVRSALVWTASSQREFSRSRDAVETCRERTTRSVGHSGIEKGDDKRSWGSVEQYARGTASYKARINDTTDAISSATVNISKSYFLKK